MATVQIGRSLESNQILRTVLFQFSSTVKFRVTFNFDNRLIFYDRPISISDDRRIWINVQLL